MKSTLWTLCLSALLLPAARSHTWLPCTASATCHQDASS